MEFYHHLHQLNPNPYIALNPLQEAGDGDRDRDRLPQWTHDETKEFLALRAELDKSFTETKRNKPLWEAISTKLQQKGFYRTPDQCKSKWKNLVSRYKGSEALEGDANRQFPFYEEIRKIFSERMERLLFFEKGKGKEVQVQVIKELEEEDENDDLEEEKLVASSSKKRKKVKVNYKGIEKDVESALREFTRRQLEMETRWLEEAEAREMERRAKEEEWRMLMEALQVERMEMQRKWREREDARSARAEVRAERRHALVMALLDKVAEKGM